ncbi:cyclic nucleotide-binding domain-containing protein [Sphingosinicella rhizophila]|uniref:Cyclic nucleotide-binding domain-containing protein n=1 Tax=Sphingosinicella rhizophila TaxID=3050082 RepID=A0ABU3QBV8_9SPHN|nr:cyclic nucleotide-binding domain-containing protein [Sphingosinicella sp. GR2756]MDT9600886.1 cyclic nucleotide-binding domain-containing protein [Sphingosinicella sp. GR2756]
MTRHATPLPAGHPCLACDVRTIAVCGVLDCGDLARMRTLGRTMRLKAGQPIFHEGDQATRVFTVTSGTLKLYKLLADGRRQITGFMFPGDFMGISVDDEHAFTVEALDDAILCSFPRNRFDEFAGEHPQLERELYRLATHELAAAQRQMVLLGRKTAVERLASFFITLLDRTGKMVEDGREYIDLPMSRSDVADYLGLTKETVSRVLALLKDQRLIRLDTLNRIEILDGGRLVDMAEGVTD